MIRSHSLSTLVLGLGLLAPPLAAQVDGNGSGHGTWPVDPTTMPRPSLAAHRIDGGIRIDGHLDEPAWAAADSSTSDFIQVQPNPGYPASEPTTIRILYDADALYIGATLYESEPDKLIVPGLEQDFATHDSDIFGIALDTYHDRQNGFLFAINPAGAVWDAQTFNDGRDVAVAWEGIVNVRTSVGADRWTVEMEIPFATLRYNPVAGDQVWGLAFSRRIRHLNEESNWAPTERQHKLYKFSLEGTLTGLRDLQKGRNLWLKPYVLGSRTTGQTLPDAVNHGDGGLDAKWGLTPRMTLDLTANTDFSQVEVDQEQVNLDRFSLFFPEKRDFFLENEGTFAFQDVTIRNYKTGSSPSSFKLFHSRRIGLSPERTPLPIAGGARLTGKVSERTEVGFLEMQTRTDGPSDAPGLYPAENFAVARVKTLLGDASNLGVMFVNRQQTASAGVRDYNRSYGVDGNLTLFDDLVLSAYAAHTDERAPTGNSREAAMFQAAWRDPLWDASVLLKHIGDDFNPGLGFVDRVGVRRLYATVGAHPQVHRERVFEVNPFVEADFYQNLDGSAGEPHAVPVVRGELHGRRDPHAVGRRIATSASSSPRRSPGREVSRRHVRVARGQGQLFPLGEPHAERHVLRHRGRLLRRLAPLPLRQHAPPAQPPPHLRPRGAAQRPGAGGSALRRRRLQRPHPVGAERAHVPHGLRPVQPADQRAHHERPLQPDPRAAVRPLRGVHGAALPRRLGRRRRPGARAHAEGDEALRVLRRGRRRRRFAEVLRGAGGGRRLPVIVSRARAGGVSASPP